MTQVIGYFDSDYVAGNWREGLSGGVRAVVEQAEEMVKNKPIVASSREKTIFALTALLDAADTVIEETLSATVQPTLGGNVGHNGGGTAATDTADVADTLAAGGSGLVGGKSSKVHADSRGGKKR